MIPKEHHESSSTIPEEVAGRMFKVASRIGVALKRKLDYDAFNLHLADGTAAGQDLRSALKTRHFLTSFSNPVFPNPRKSCEDFQISV